jgi:5-methylcytosine-specific restriction endonuclease McrA
MVLDMTLKRSTKTATISTKLIAPCGMNCLLCRAFTRDKKPCGHICPVVFVGESITETTETRRRGRYIPFQTKMRVVRRDNYTCQRCGKHLQDNEVEFDHIIPHAKGGSCEEHNIRLTCYDCNRNKSDGFEL